MKKIDFKINASENIAITENLFNYKRWFNGMKKFSSIKTLPPVAQEEPLNFYFYTSVAFEDWNWENSIEKGIGGSETSIVEMSWRLARRGHNVTVYAPIPKDSPHEWRGTKWYRFEEATFKEPGIWVIYRVPEAADSFPKDRIDHQYWLLWQDWDYPTLTKKRAEAFNLHITLCKAHGKYMLDRYPFVAGRQWLSSNGVKVDLLEEIEKENIVRNPKKIMYASSPDRGMKYALQVFKKAREFVPDIELHMFYGFDNLDKLIKDQPDSPLAKSKAEIMELLKQPNVNFHGRISQPELYRQWLSTGIWIYITNFFETSNITGMEAQGMGAVPVFSPIFAQKENIRNGIGIEGPAEEPLTIARAAAEVVRLALQPELQDQIREDMVPWARKRFNWEVFVTQWILEAQGKRGEFEKHYEFPTQL
jgi:glycosyltransferase involved in cell wall biosynthesis